MFASEDDHYAEFTDARGHTERWILHRSSRVGVIIDAIGRVTRHERDDDGLPIQTTRPNGSVITRQFDALGNPIEVLEQFNGARWTARPITSFSQVLTQHDANGNPTTYQRDLSNGNLRILTDALGHQTQFDYNTRGQVIERTDPNGVVSVFDYNAQGLLERLTETPPAGGGAVRVTQYFYDAAGLLDQVITPDGVTLSYDYDLRGRLLGVDG